MLKQVGVTALRGPDGRFLPSVPLFVEVPDEDKTEEITEAELERLFIERMRKYADASKPKLKRKS